MYNLVVEYIDFETYKQDITELKPIKHWLNEKKYTSKDNEISYRIINHWASLGLIKSGASGANGWHKFSLLDLLWVLVLSELRKYGMPLDRLKEVQKYLFNSPLPPYNPEPAFAYYTFLAFNNNPVFLIVFENGFVTTTGGNETLETQWKISNSLEKYSYITINLNGLLNKLLKHTEEKPIFAMVSDLDKSEKSIVEALRQGKFEKVTITFRDKKPLLLEGTEILPNSSNIEKILKEYGYENIEFKTEEGKIVKIVRTVKDKI